MSVWFDGSYKVYQRGFWFGSRRNGCTDFNSFINTSQCRSNISKWLRSFNSKWVRVEAQATSSSYDAFADTLKLAIDETRNDYPSIFKY